MDTLKAEQIKQAVRERYGAIAIGSLSSSSCCGESTPAQKRAASPCCPSKEPASLDAENTQNNRSNSSEMAELQHYSNVIGYSNEDVLSVPIESNMALGCGNPTAIANLKDGEVVLDLGSGGGFDCFLASQQVGARGKVIGVDMTPEMVSKARENAVKGKFTNVEFRLGEIEYIPAANSTVDAIISNCVINLSTDKPQVFRDAFRVLKPGGRLAISDVVLTAQLPDGILNDLSMYCACTAGAISIEEYQTILRDAGFGDISIVPKEDSREFIREWREGMKLDDYLISAIIEARKP